MTRAEVESSQEFLTAQNEFSDTRLGQFSDTDINSDGFLNKAELAEFLLRIHTLDDEIRTFAEHILSARGRWFIVWETRGPCALFILPAVRFVQTKISQGR